MKHFLCILFVVLAAAPLSGLRADSPASPYSYKRVTKNGKYIFVLLAWANRDYDPENLKEKYSVSGLYLNDGSTTPLWKFLGQYSFAVEVSSDGRHLIQGGDWPRIGDKGETAAVSFYRDGSPLRTYLIKDLVPNIEAMPQSVSHYEWARSSVFDDEKSRLTIETLAGKDSPSKKYVFDVTTGKILDDKPEAKKSKP